MAFLDNSGDIILDAVLTDTGRLRMAQGNGSFKISKFALGDDEINYSLYNKDHLSGSAYYDLEVLQTPVLEAFTNNTSNLKTKLVTMSRTNVLYMPILKLNSNDVAAPDYQALPSLTWSRQGTVDGGTNVTNNKPYVAVDKDTYKFLNMYRDGSDHKAFDSTQKTTGLIQGFTADSAASSDVPKGGSLIRVDHGLDTIEVSTGIGLDSDLQETAFIVELDYRLGRIKLPNQDSVAPVNFIDDDNIATYYLTSTGNNGYINPGGEAYTPKSTNTGDATFEELSSTNPQVFRGPRGNTFQFRVHASQELQQSVYLYTQLGTYQSAIVGGNIGGFNAADPLLTNKNIYYIDSVVRVVGANTGYRMDIPIRFVKVAN